MRPSLFVLVVASAACGACVTRGESGSSADAMVEREPRGALFTTAPPARPGADGAAADAVDDDADADDLPWWDTNPPDPGGWCRSRGARARCVKGGTCTFTGHCTLAGAPPPDAGAESCGLVACDREWCTCISAVDSTCDCSP